MKKFVSLFLFAIFLSGCATYKFQRGQEPYNKGYVVSRDDYAILEYTIGKDNNVPDLKGAQERFNRRRKIVEHYYKKMGYIENHFKMTFWDPPIIFAKFFKGVLRLPFVAISDYRYEHNPKYKERIRRIEDEEDRREEERINKLKGQLNMYIQQDMASELEIKELEKGKITKPAEGIITETLTRIEQETKQAPQEELVQSLTVEQPFIPAEEKPKTSAEKKVKVPRARRIVSSHQPLAIIIAKPTKGFSPLRVHFYGYKSYAPGRKIVSYSWDFGDGDTSSQANPINTYYSGTFAPQDFTVTLTVQDNQGNTAQAAATIEVLNK